MRAYNELMGEAAPRLDGVEFGVLALGDTAYVEFCAIGKKIDERLAALGGKRVVDRVDCDLDFAEPAARWIGDAVKVLTPPNAGGRVIEVDFGGKPAAPASTDIIEAEITEHVDLNSSRSDKETIHLALSFENGAPAYQPGDSLDLYPENDPAYVDELLKVAGLAGDEKLRARLHQVARRDHVVAQDGRDLRREDRPSIRQGADRRRAGARMDRRTPADRPDRNLSRLRSMPRRCAR